LHPGYTNFGGEGQICLEMLLIANLIFLNTIPIQLNLFIMVTWGTEESGCCGEVESWSLKEVHESMYELSTKKVAIVERWPLWRGNP